MGGEATSKKIPGAVIGIGTDIVAVTRIARMLEKHDQAFLDRVFTLAETAYCGQHKASAQHFAGRWAAKEAALKALGTGWARGIEWVDIEITNLPGGAPVITLHNKAAIWATELGIRELQVSISHCEDFAVAFVVANG
jgi:holo-[acyl-carrier protein] synthase